MLLSAAGSGMAWPAAGAVTLSLLRVLPTAVLLLASLPSCSADPAPVIHYAPGETLDRAEHEIVMAAYDLTDWPVMKRHDIDLSVDKHARAFADGLPSVQQALRFL
jgi:hypothetical protein